MRTNHLSGMLSFALGCIAQGGACQTPFQRQYGGAESETATHIALAGDGGYLIAGSTRSYGSGETDAYVIRVSAQGDTLWTRTLGGVGWESANAILGTSTNSWLVAGSTSSSSSGPSDAFLFELDDSGNLIWSKTYGSGGPEGAQWLTRTSNGDVLLCGHSGSGGTGMYLVRMTADGDTVWTRKTKLIGGSLVSMVGESVVETGDGSLLVLGDANDLSVCYYYLDADGVAVASGTFNGLQNYVNRLHVINVSAGGYLVTGTTATSGLALDAFAMRLDEDLNPLWTKRYGGTQSERIGCVVECSDGGFALLGRTWSFGPPENDSADVYLLKLDPDGNLLWSRTYGGSAHEEGQHMVQLPDGGFCILGTISDGEDILLFTVDADGHGGCSEDSPPTTASPITCNRTWLNRQATIGAIIGEPPFLIGHGGLVTDPCTGPIAVPEPLASTVLAWQLVGSDIVLSGSSSNGYFTVLDAACRKLMHARASEGTTIIPSLSGSAGAFVATYSDGRRSSSFRFIRP